MSSNDQNKHDKCYREIENTRETCDDDGFHWAKRIMGFDCFDDLLEKCYQGVCPISELRPASIYMLTDISIEGFINIKAYLLGEEGIGNDHAHRYHMAEKKIKHVFKCQKDPGKISDVFKIDTNELMNKNVKPEAFHGARKRKAFWAYLTYRPHNTPQVDYLNSEKFIHEIHFLSNKNVCSTQEIETIKILIESNRHIANALDLYRYCYIKHKVLKKEE